MMPQRMLAGACALACLVLRAAAAGTCVDSTVAQPVHQAVACSSNFCNLANAPGAPGADTNVYTQYSSGNIALFFTWDPVGNQWLNYLPTQQSGYDIEAVESSAYQNCASQQSLDMKARIALNQQPSVTINQYTYTCTLCQYHNDNFYNSTGNCQNPMPIPRNSIFRSSSFNPMFGPCFDTAPSILAKCAQNAALYPPGFVGYYFYPLQQSWPEYLLQEYIDNADPFPVNAFFSPSAVSANAGPATSNPPTASPSTYGLGRTAVESDINTYVVYNKSYPTQIDANLTANFRAPFLNGGYVKWAQHFCAPGCHRDSFYSRVTVNASDANTSEFSYLSRFVGAPRNWVVRCSKCPLPGAVGYNWHNQDGTQSDGPEELRTNIISLYCYPWFGSIPVMIAKQDNSGHTVGFNATLTTVANYIVPDQVAYVAQTPCPVNTYSRECAHAKRWYYWQSVSPTISDANLKAQYLANYSCTPCPANWTTGGLTGAWFCIPPPGVFFVNAQYLNDTGRQTGNGWASRDEFQTEPECGYLPEHCQQCASFTYPSSGASMAGALPADFNELIFFSILLETTPCAANMYCPDAFTQIQCPTHTPYSPGGIWSAAQCGCNAGSYGPAANGTCITCRSTNSCPPGTYLPLDCFNKPGQRTDQACVPCPNLPPGNFTLRAFSVALPDSNSGACSFACNNGFTLQPNTGNCHSTFTCVDASPVQLNDKGASNYALATGAYIYAPSASVSTNVDSFDASACAGTPVSITFTSLVNNGINGDDKTDWLVTTMTCVCGQPLCYSSRTPWYSLYADTICAPCPIPYAPLNGSINEDVANSVTLDKATACSAVSCNIAGYYLNKTAWACQSCAARAAAICPPGRTTIKGQGCLSDPTPFNTTDPTADCVACNFNILTLLPGTFLNLNLANGCKNQTCTAPPIAPSAAGVSVYYSTPPCGGLLDNNWKPCSTTCGNGYYVKQQCSPAADMICVKCSTPAQGFYAVGSCSNGGVSDTYIQGCPAGYYCPGGNITKQACPNGQQSIAGTPKTAGASTVLDCYCPVGTRVSNGVCTPYTCTGNTSTALGTPGVLAWTSPQYMTLDMSQQPLPVTVCRNCSAPGTPAASASFARGGGIELDSCTCPAGYYGTLSTSGTGSTSVTYLVCTACTRQTCNGGAIGPMSVGPDICWTGDSRNAQQCSCQNPPFGYVIPTDGSCKNVICDDPNSFNAVQTAGAPAAGSTGSAMYVAEKYSKIGWTRTVHSFDNMYFYYQNVNRPATSQRVTSLAVSNYVSDGLYVPNEAQFLVWSVYGYPVVFMAQVYPMLQAPGVNTTLQYTLTDPFSSNLWETGTTPGDVVPEIVGLAMGPWGVGTSPSSSVCAVLYYEADPPDAAPFLELRCTILDIALANSGGAWGATLPVIQIVQLPGVSFVAMATAQTIPGITAPTGDVFYVAYNTAAGCGGISYASPWWTPSHNTQATPLNGVCTACMQNGLCPVDVPGPISAFGMRTSSDGLNMYIAYHGSSALYAIPFTSTTLPAFSTISSKYVFLPAQPASPLLQGPVVQIFGGSTPIVVVGVGNSSGVCPGGVDGCIVTADAAQRTFTAIQGMPWGTTPAVPSPDTGVVFGVAGMATTVSTGVLVVAYNDGIYVIDVSLCAPQANGQPTYFDGADPASGDPSAQTCVAHQCVRTRDCGATQQTVGTYDCECIAGYYDFMNGAGGGTVTCQPCPTSNYCLAGQQPQPCKNTYAGTDVSTTGSTSADDCTCQSGYYWQQTPGFACEQCPPGAWCPNGWKLMLCPGSYRAPTTTTANVYPYACLCQAGYTGPGCTPCPAGHICPVSKSSVVNSVSILNVTLQPGFNVPAATAAVQALLLSYFQSTPTYGVTALGYMTNQQTLSQRLYVGYVPETNNSFPLITVMLQFDGSSIATGDVITYQQWIDILTGTGGLTCTHVAPQALASAGFCIVSVTPTTANNIPTPANWVVPNNTATPCPAGQSPAATMDVCECAAGYQTATGSTACSACPAGTYKASQGAGLCTACAIGATSDAGSAQCTASATPAPSQDSGGGLSTTVIIGIAAGGGVLLLGMGGAFAAFGQ